MMMAPDHASGPQEHRGVVDLSSRILFGHAEYHMHTQLRGFGHQLVRAGAGHSYRRVTHLTTGARSRVWRPLGRKGC